MIPSIVYDNPSCTVLARYAAAASVIESTVNSVGTVAVFRGEIVQSCSSWTVCRYVLRKSISTSSTA